MPRTCTVCRHPKRAAIDAAVVANVPVRDIASHFGGFSYGSLQRHIGACMGEALTKAVDAEMAQWGASTDERIREVIAEARANLELARANDDAAGANGAVGLILKTLALSAKLRGEINDGPAVHIDARSVQVMSDRELLESVEADVRKQLGRP